MNRLHTIDYLRGVLALFIMFYHYTTWEHIYTMDATSFLARNALYGVSMFFVISGFSLGVTYLNSFDKISFLKIKNFYIKRFARIYPLFWLIISLYLLLVMFSGKILPNVYDIISNFTISFSFMGDSKALTTGGWSIGVEIFLYILFPFLIYFLNQNVYFTTVFFVLFIVLSIYISSYCLYNTSDANNYWDRYLYLINHVYFFIFGVLIAKLYKQDTFLKFNKKYTFSLLVFSIFIFIFYPIDGHVINLILEENRVMFTLDIFLLFVLLVNYDTFLNKKSNKLKILDFFGEISYTLYLLHPIVYMLINHFIHINSSYKVLLMVLVTIIASKFIYLFYEIKMKNVIVHKLMTEGAK